MAGGTPRAALGELPEPVSRRLFSYFTWSRSGDGNSSIANPHPLTGPMPAKVYCEYSNYMFVDIVSRSQIPLITTYSAHPPPKLPHQGEGFPRAPSPSPGFAKNDNDE
jgi:hypothetical protein